MADVLLAFSAIWAVTAVGWLLGRFGVLGPGAEAVLARLVFFVATPALLLVTLSATTPGTLVSRSLFTYVASAVGLAAVTAAVARFWWRLPPGDVVIAALGSAYVNAANLGIPVAGYVFGDISVVAPVLLFQLLLASPVALGLLESGDGAPSRRGLATRLVLLPVRNPILLASAVGLVLAVLAWRLPIGVERPFDLVGQAAVPTALLALGLSLSSRGEPLASTVDAPAAVRPRTMVLTVVALKVLVQPSLAYLVGLGLGLSGRVLLGSVVMSGLPAAQNVFVYASRYGRGVALARGAVAVSTVVAPVTLAAATQLLR
jgi:malonate transporter